MQLRNLVSSHKEIAAELAKVEVHVAKHDKEIRLIFEAIRRFDDAVCEKAFAQRL